MMGGMGVFMVLGLLVVVVLARWLLLPQRASEVQAKRKNEDLLSQDASYELDDEGEIVDFAEEKVKRNF